jgi:hypothetical protein
MPGGLLRRAHDGGGHVYHEHLTPEKVDEILDNSE